MKLSLTLLCLLSFSVFLPKAQSQSLVWQKKITAPNGTLEGRFLDSKTAPDGKVYSVGYFFGKKANLGNLEIWADSSIHIDSLETYLLNIPYTFITGFIACQDTEGNFIWARPINGDYSFCYDYFELRCNIAKICLDETGNIFVSGQARGNNASFNNVPFYQSLPPNVAEGNVCKRLAFILKLSPQGDLLWNTVRHFELEVDPVYLEYSNGKIESVIQHNGLINDNTLNNFDYDTAQFLYEKISTTGVIEYTSNLKIYQTIPNGSINGRNIFKRFSDQTWGIGLIRDLSNWSPARSNQFIVMVSSDFSTITDTLSFYVKSPNRSYNNDLIGNDIIEFPEGKKGLILSCGHTIDGSEQLFFGNDTLDLNLVPPTQTWIQLSTFLLKIEGLSCAKKVTQLPDPFYLGNGSDQTSSGNFFTVNAGSFDSLKLKQFDRNGNQLSAIPLVTFSWVNTFSLYNWIPGAGDNFNSFRLSRSSSHLILTLGSNIYKFAINEIETSEISFPGCLSNSTLLTSVAKEMEKPAFLFKEGDGLVYNQTEALDGQYQLFNTQGKTMVTGTISGQETRIKASMPSGIYLLKVSTKGKQTTHRVMW